MMAETAERTPYDHDLLIRRLIALVGPSIDQIASFLAFITEGPDNLSRPDGTLLARFKKWQRRKEKRGS